MSKLAIAAETEEDRYDTQTQVKCFECGVVDSTKGKLPAVIDGVLKANTFARQAEVQAWEQEMTPCEHTLCLQQEAPRNIQSQGLLTSFRCGALKLTHRRPWPLLVVRSEGEPMAMPTVRKSGLWQGPIRRCGW